MRLLLPLFFATNLFAQQQEPFKIDVEVNLVNLPVTARLVSGGFAKDLTKENFRVFEDGVEQEISLFVQEAVPVHVVLLIDISGSVQNVWGSIRSAARRFANALSEQDRLAVIVFNNQPQLVLDWTNNYNLVDKALGTMLPKGGTALFDAVYVTFDDLFQSVEGKKAVILLTDGFDTGSSVAYRTALDLAVRSTALVYVVSKTEALRQTLDYYRRVQGARIQIDPADFTAADNMLRHLTYTTGGRVLYPKTFGALGDVYEEVAQELANQYAIGYIPHNHVKDGSYREVSVAINRTDVRIFTRPGYYAPIQ